MSIISIHCILVTMAIQCNYYIIVSLFITLCDFTSFFLTAHFTNKLNIRYDGIELRSRAIGVVEGCLTQKETVDRLGIGERSVRRWWTHRRRKLYFLPLDCPATIIQGRSVS